MVSNGKMSKSRFLLISSEVVSQTILTGVIEEHQIPSSLEWCIDVTINDESESRRT